MADPILSRIFNLIYPVGAIYISVNSTNPSTLFGGTWEQLKDRFLLGAGSTYSNGATGGEATHTLTENEMPVHKHTLTFHWSSGEGNSGSGVPFMGDGTKIIGGDNSGVSNTGSGQAHNNMPPYLVVYMWKRTA